jgi:hypothetical protein
MFWRDFDNIHSWWSSRSFQVAVNLTTVCDDEIDPLLQDGKFAFDTSTFQNDFRKSNRDDCKIFWCKWSQLVRYQIPSLVTPKKHNSCCRILLTQLVHSIILPFIVNSLPPINLNTDGSENELVCSNLPTFFVTLNAGIQDGSQLLTIPMSGLKITFFFQMRTTTP